MDPTKDFGSGPYFKNPLFKTIESFLADLELTVVVYETQQIEIGCQEITNGVEGAEIVRSTGRLLVAFVFTLSDGVNIVE